MAAMGWWGYQRQGWQSQKGKKGAYKWCGTCSRWAHAWRGDKCICGGTLGWGHGGGQPPKTPVGKTSGHEEPTEGFELCRELMFLLSRGEVDTAATQLAATHILPMLGGSASANVGVKNEGQSAKKARALITNLQNQYQQALQKRGRLTSQLRSCEEQISELDRSILEAQGARGCLQRA